MEGLTVDMTLNQFNTLSEDEIVIALHIVNVVAPPGLPKMTFEPRHLTWFKHDLLVKKFIDAFPSLKPEGHSTYTSLMQKLGVCVQINQNPPPNENNPDTQPPTNIQIEGAGSTTPREEVKESIDCPSTQSVDSDVKNVTGSVATGSNA
jgi:hypothetical protein